MLPAISGSNPYFPDGSDFGGVKHAREDAVALGSEMEGAQFRM